MVFTYKIEQYQVAEPKKGSQKTPYRRRLFSEQDAAEEERRQQRTANGLKKFIDAGGDAGKYVEVIERIQGVFVTSKGLVTKKKRFGITLDKKQFVFFKRLAHVQVVDAPAVSETESEVEATVV